MAKNNITSTITSNEKSQATLLVVVDKSLVKQEKEKTLSHLAQGVTVKGFRQGKAPLDLIEKKLDPTKVTEHTINHLLPLMLKAAVDEHKLDLISYPKLQLTKLEPDQDWEFTLLAPLRPEIKLGDYKKAIKAGMPSDPSKPKDDSKDKEEKEKQRLQKLLEILLKEIKVEVPAILIDDEVQESLSRLLKQVQTLGLEIDEYLKSVGKTPQSIRDEYAKAASENIALELILAAIGADLKIEVSKPEIEALIAASGDEATKKSLDTPSQRRHIMAILRQRKTITALLNL